MFDEMGDEDFHHADQPCEADLSSKFQVSPVCAYHTIDDKTDHHDNDAMQGNA